MMRHLFDEWIVLKLMFAVFMLGWRRPNTTMVFLACSRTRGTDGKPVAVLGASVGTLSMARAQYHWYRRYLFSTLEVG
jgi:hypothetical protein